MKIEISNGELLDKLTILEIKLRNISDVAKNKNVKKEYEYLLTVAQFIEGFSVELLGDLSIVNQQIWEIEDKIREKERKKEFDQEFIELARSVYFKNDERSRIKKQINIKTESEFIEEKSYKKY